MKNSIELSIIIVNWNGIGFVPECFRSVAKYPPSATYEVIVVDNGSSDGSQDWLGTDEAKNIFPDGCFKFIKSSENLGFGRANNLAFSHSLAPWTLLLNPDTILTAGAIDKLLETSMSRPDIGVVAPLLRNTDGSLQPNVCVLPNPFNIVILDLRLERYLPRRRVSEWFYSSFWDYNVRKAVPIVSGAAMMVRREVIDTVGGFSDAYHMYGEDVEWCVRIRKGGWQIIFEPQAEIYHLGGQSSSQRWPGESGVREHESGIIVQLNCLAPHLVILNTMARIFTYGLFFLKNLSLGKDTSVIAKVLSIQARGMKSAVIKCFNVNKYRST